MAHKVIKISLFVVLVTALWDAAAPQSGCPKTLMGLSPCLNYVSGNSSTPTAPCCSQLSNIVQSQPQCLCLLLNGTASSYGFNINQTLALALPGACKVQTPPVSRCNSANGQSAPPPTPESPPADSSKTPETKPSGSDIPSGSKLVPSQNGASVSGNNVIAVFLVFVASYAVSVAGF